MELLPERTYILLKEDVWRWNKIFYAMLAVQFRDFVQTEYFRIVALGSQADTTNISTTTAAGTSTTTTVGG